MHLSTSPRLEHPLCSGVSAILIALALASCSHDQAEQQQGADPLKASHSANSAQGAPRAVALISNAGVTHGSMPAGDDARIAKTVGNLVDDWLTNAYLAGPWPRRNFTDVWPHFTTDLKHRAHAERATTSNAEIAARIDGVRALTRLVIVDVLAASNKAAGATARLKLEFVTSGQVRQKVTISGQLYLTPTKSGWAIFGYDLTRTVAELGARVGTSAGPAGES